MTFNPNKGNPMKAVGYIRVSKASQAEDGVSLAAQREKIEAYARLHDLDLVQVLADEGISGKRSDNRPGLQEALRLACRHKATLVFYSLTRLARSTRDCIDIFESVSKCGAHLASVTEKFDTSSGMGEFLFTLMAALGQLERKQIGERTKLGMDYKRRRGERIGRVPFGQRVADDGVKLIPEPKEQSTLAIMRRMRTGGKSYAFIAAELNRQELPAKAGGQWHVKTVFGVLKRHP